MLRLNLASMKSSLLMLLATCVFAHSSFADTLNLNYTATSDDGLSVDYATVNSGINTLPVTSISTYSHVFPTADYATIPGTTFEFYDDYVFTIGESLVSSITATIDLGGTFNLDGLNVRLFSWDGKDEQLYGTVTLGSAGSANLIQAWTYATGTGEVAVIDQDNLAAGTYVLQVRGSVTGTAGGGYVGSLNVTPVPVPAALPLLLSGLGMLGGALRRRRSV